jgi:hypothetical protein
MTAARGDQGLPERVWCKPRFDIICSEARGEIIHDPKKRFPLMRHSGAQPCLYFIGVESFRVDAERYGHRDELFDAVRAA